MRRLVVVSNRLPSKGGTGSGGLVVALGELLERHSGLWLGWSENLSDTADSEVAFDVRHGISCATIDLTADEYRKYYTGYANGVLWPLLHIMPGLVSTHRGELAAYRAVNARFAAALARIVDPGDVLWVHDYHLFALPALIRARGLDNPVGFFLHVPFPPPAVAAISEGLLGLVRDVLAADLIGFQTETDADHFADTAVRYAGARRVSDVLLMRDGRQVRLSVFPVEIDAKKFAASAVAAMRRKPAKDFAQALGDRKLILGIDRLDPSKGLEERLTAYHQLLSSDRDLHERVFYLQIAARSREDVAAYRNLRSSLENAAGCINCTFSLPNWTPLQLVTQGSAHAAVAGYMRQARVGLVTPLRDGMNLVAKEFVAAQDPQDPGVLVLSKFAGAATQLRGALVVNPYDCDELETALARALAMPIDQRRQRWASQWNVLKAESAVRWGETFTEALLSLREPAAPAKRPVIAGASQAIAIN